MKKLIVICMLMSLQAQARGTTDIGGSSTLSADKVNGLVCDYQPGLQESKMKIEISIEGKTAVLLFRDAFSLSGTAEVFVPAKDIQPILKQDLAKMNGVSLKDSQQNISLNMRVDGYTFDHKPRLGIKVNGDLNLYLSSCQIELDSKVQF